MSKKASTESKVKLNHIELDQTHTFGIEHANRIFKVKNHGWELNDSNYELNKDGIITKRDHRAPQSAEKQTTA